MKENMSKAGYVQGDMSPKVEEYGKPMSSFSQEGFSKTTQYVERNDAYLNKEAAGIRKQSYQGRYS